MRRGIACPGAVGAISYEEDVMRSRLILLICFGLFGLVGCAAQPAPHDNPLTAAPPLAPGMARIWMLRQINIAHENFAAADPAVFINNVDLGHVAEGTVFYHDVPPGTYRLRAQPYGTPAHLGDTVELGSGVTAFLQVQEIPNWEAGSSVGGASFDMLTMVPQDAEAAIPTLNFIGRR
jgi:hypothetical protein